jgi:hypothetical protein
MAKTTAERQAAYRARQGCGSADGNGQRRIRMWLGTVAAVALARLALRYGITQRALIERMVLEEDARVLETLATESAKWDSYFALVSMSKADKPREV